MNTKRISQLLLILGILGFCIGNSALALTLTLVSWGPPGPAWIAHYPSSPCVYTYYTINTASYRDFTEEEKIADYYWFLNVYGSHVSPIPYSSTWAFNCHGYLFIEQSGWLNSPISFLRSNIYKIDNCDGFIYRFKKNHSANPGAFGYPYYAKCGKGPYAYHDNFINLYGTHYQRWSLN